MGVTSVLLNIDYLIEYFSAILQTVGQPQKNCWEIPQKLWGNPEHTRD